MEHTWLFFLFTCQPIKGCNCNRSGVNVRACYYVITLVGTLVRFEVGQNQVQKSRMRNSLFYFLALSIIPRRQMLVFTCSKPGRRNIILRQGQYDSLHNKNLRDFYSYFSNKTYVVGTHKNRLNEAVLMSSQNTCFN